MTTLMRCNTVHWAGDYLVKEGVLVADGATTHPNGAKVVPEFFEKVEFPDSPPPKKPSSR